MKSRIINIALCASLLGSPMAFAESTEYYRHIVFRESPFENLRGNHPIDAAQAAKSMHYRFVRDDHGRIVEVSKRMGETIVPVSDGSWDSFLWFSPVLRIEYKDGMEIRHFLDGKYERMAAHGAVYEQRFAIDASGRRKSVHFYGKDAKPIESEWGIQRYEWQILADGAVIENRFNAKNESVNVRPDFPFGRIRMEFGHDDLLDFVYNIDAKGNLIENNTGAAIDRIVYDLSDNFIRWQVYNKDRQPVNGNGPKVAMGEHLYDARGNKIGLRGFDVDGKDKAFSFGGKFANDFDVFGNVVRTRVMDVSGIVEQDVRIKMSEDGLRRAEVSIHDGQGQLKNSEGGYAKIVYQYDENNRQTGVKMYDNELREVQPPAQGR